MTLNASILRQKQSAATVVRGADWGGLMRSCAIPLAAAALLAACSDNSSGAVTNYDAIPPDQQNQSAMMNADQPAPSYNAALNSFQSAAAEPQAPQHNYKFRDGELYGYIGGISEEDQKKGIAAPPVIRFRYTGFWAGAQHLQVVDDNGAVTEIDECAVPCVAIKATAYNGSVSRYGYTPDSVVGAAFQDAMNGLLKRAPALGTVRNGYRYMGGDPGSSSNWQPLSSGAAPNRNNMGSPEPAVFTNENGDAATQEFNEGSGAPQRPPLRKR
jgi:hypothetical protein